jgi:ubiquinone/menaquinone biosynthesis C-methylase UbiE
MKSKIFKLKSLLKYKNTAIILFRGIEMKMVSVMLKKYKLSSPSLDLGSGDGFISSILFKKRFDIGVDNDENKDTLLAIKNKRYKKVLIESAEKMSVKKKSLNFVFSNSVIEHIPNNKAVLSEVSRVLKPGGYFIFTCPSVYFTQFLSEKYSSVYASLRNKQLNHFHLLNHKQWTKRLNKVNLEVINFTYYTTKTELLVWEKLVWLNKIKDFFGISSKSNRKAEIAKIKSIVDFSKTSKKHGANIIIVAKKK